MKLRALDPHQAHHAAGSDLADRDIVLRRGRICANLNLKENEITGEDVLEYITGARTKEEYAEAA